MSAGYQQHHVSLMESVVGGGMVDEINILKYGVIRARDVECIAEDEQ